MSLVRRTQRAQMDLLAIGEYLFSAGGTTVLDRFLLAAEQSFLELATHPMLGTLFKLRRPGLAGMRRWRIKRFNRYLIFYLPQNEGVLIVRVLHEARDVNKIIGIQKT
ncbi:type II toxin-antitoxin system RelE/ParE family toxin [Massilia sp. YIM B04103]|uniref:type II toxin-antitoxin system RelE/ParE family toxin n=1 Tax=Massilia sp. YIM B04103 TaxID=2963106 RepID=UPI00210B175D|nr:type II toxin-antitoxin system RelE/ParE family toxin [Massilia sp. YIM B04103]